MHSAHTTAPGRWAPQPPAQLGKMHMKASDLERTITVDDMVEALGMSVQRTASPPVFELGH